MSVKLPMKIQVKVYSSRGIHPVSSYIHHKVAHALGMRHEGNYPLKDYEEAKSLNERYTKRISDSY